ncbi:MAG: hypothetical protein HY582_01495 [Candidatus Omnitrophica bacterium]|nr:hypothetical protein [Candidatus Omnitrophota bacterium]
MKIQSPLPFPNKDNLNLSTGKALYRKGEPVEFELENHAPHHGALKTVYVFPTIFDELKFQGSVISLTQKSSAITTYNDERARTDKAERIWPEPVKLLPGSSLKGSWSGVAFQQISSDSDGKWNSYQPIGKFKIKIAYSFDQPDLVSARDKILSFVESNEFEIK